MPNPKCSKVPARLGVNNNNNNNGNFIKICYIDISTIINLTTKVIYNCLLEPDKKL